ncbi:MAG: PilN domain-containing protein [Cyanobacteria bacterium SBLK]|nr:PilN domain-containing protein [Cyanobacteria bacterium SBLK]
MYSLDINFLNDRAAVTAAPAGGGVSQAPVRKITLDELIPAFIGGAIGVLGLVAAGAGWVYINLQTAQYEEQSRILDGELNLLQQQNQKIQDLERQIQVAQRQRDGLATVFVKILPWSAVLADIRDRIPPGVQLTSIVEKAPDATAVATPPPPAPGQEAAAPVPAKPMPSLTLSGYADSYDTVNYFFLALGRSLFFNAEKGRITSAKLVDDPNSLKAEEENATVSLDLPQVVQYTLEIELNDLSAQPPAELATQLESKGAIGSVVRLKNLEQKGLIAPQQSN